MLLYGDYQRKDLGRVVELGPKGKAAVLHEAVAVDDRGEPMIGALAWGVGPSLFLWKDRRVFVVEDW